MRLEDKRMLRDEVVVRNVDGLWEARRPAAEESGGGCVPRGGEIVEALPFSLAVGEKRPPRG